MYDWNPFLYRKKNNTPGFFKKTRVKWVFLGFINLKSWEASKCVQKT